MALAQLERSKLRATAMLFASELLMPAERICCWVKEKVEANVLFWGVRIS